MFSAERLVLARKRRRLTQIRLAELSGLSASLVRQYEHARVAPPSGTVETLAKTLRFPVSFFEGGPVDEIPPASASFRALTKTPAALRDAALAAGSLASSLGSWIDSRFDLPPVDIPDLEHVEAEPAAEQVRASWGLSDAPIRNMLHLLEAHGVRVFSLAQDTKDIDAFAVWLHQVPFVFLNTGKTAERSRFDAAHELAHLVLHRDAAQANRDLEAEANRFASAFLMPRSSLIAHAPRSPSLSQLIKAKTVWRVSLASLTHRLHAVGLLSDWQYRHLCVELARRGYRRTEPEPLPRETSQILAKVFAQLRSEGVSKASVAQELNLTPRDLDALVFGLVVTSVD
jgi:Zn-dependent peptidase ImmA (M78 family)